MKLRLITYLSLVYLTQLGAAEVVDAQKSLIEAVESNDADGVRVALAHGATDHDFGGYENPRIMHWAVLHDADRAIEALAQDGWDVNVKDYDGNTPLYYAIFIGGREESGSHPQLIGILARYGANINGTPINQYLIHRTIADIADNNNKLEVVKELLKAGAPVNGRDRDMNTPLHVAAMFNNVDAINLLVSFGADLNARDRNGDTPLHKAISFNAKKALIRLLELGAEADERNNAGQTPREYAQAVGNHDLAQTTGL